MGLFMMSSSSYDSSPKIKVVHAGNPDPENYTILRSCKYKKYLLVEVRYPDCTNYEGHKILLYKKTTLKDLLIQGSIDPHFAANKEKHSPIARFEPTDEGWEMGINVMEHKG